VSTLTLADPRGLESLLPDTPVSRDMATQLAASFSRLHRNLAAGEVDRAAREFVDALAGPGAWARRPPEQKQWFLDNIATAVDTGESPPLACGDVAALALPLLLVTGERSPPRYREMFAAMRACNAALPSPVTIPDATHAMQRDNPAGFNAAVMEFLAGTG
jgi:pimeloyl-ACP methyl ester carboxylesterase